MNAGQRIAATVTPTGRGVAVAAIALAVLAGILHFPELAVLAVACLTALIAAAVIVARSPALDATIEIHPDRVGRREPATARVTLRNHESRTIRGLTLRLPHGDTGTDAFVRSVGPRADVRIDVPLPTDRRGTLPVGPVTVERADPFRLLVRTRLIGEPAVLHVYPNAYPLEPLPSARSSSPDGLAVDSAVEGGVTFHALREYVPGDDPRRVHWRSSAKAGTLLVRLNVDPSEPVTTVLLDTRREAYPAESPDEAGIAFDAAVDAAASILLAASRRRFPLRLRTTSRVRIAGRGNRADEAAVLDALSAATLDGSDAGDTGGPAADGQSLTDLVRSVRGGAIGTLALVTGPVDAGQLAAVAPAVGRYEHVVVVRAGATATSAHVPPQRGATGTTRLRVIDIDGAEGLLAAWPTGSSGRTR